MSDNPVYKIQRESDELFSNGGAEPDFTKRGKIWSHRGFVEKHMQQVQDPSRYNGCVLVEYHLGLVKCNPLLSVPNGKEVGKKFDVMVMPDELEGIA